MAIHVTIQGAFQPIGGAFRQLNADDFETVRNALRSAQTELITPDLETNWQDLRTDGGSINNALDSAYGVVRSQLPPPPDKELVITQPGSEEWLDLGQQGHEFAKQLRLQSEQTRVPQPWRILADVPALGTFQANLFITGRITTDEAGPPN